MKRPLPRYLARCLICLLAALGGACGDGAAKAPPGFTQQRRGDLHDFDYLIGAWTTQQRRLQARNSGSSEWVSAPANVHCAARYLDGEAIVEESRSPGNAAAGLFLYAFDRQRRQWSIYWMNAKTGQLDPPLIGGFAAGRGEFYGEDHDCSRAIRVRVLWSTSHRDHARWEQAFSYDNQAWETNWVSDFTRSAQPRACSADLRPAAG